jgi:hypothetical protein
MELDLLSCEVIVQRSQQFTSQEIERREEAA